MQHSRLITLCFLSAILFLHGCHSVKKTLGIERDPPDEFAVTPSNQPLDMPPDFFTLPEPNPGKPRPQDEREAQARNAKLLGANPTEGSLSPGQKALLEMAGTEEGQDQIRGEIDKESRIESTKGKPVLQRLGLQKEKAVGEVINPYEEALELEQKGISQNQGSHK